MLPAMLEQKRRIQRWGWWSVAVQGDNSRSNILKKVRENGPRPSGGRGLRQEHGLFFYFNQRQVRAEGLVWTWRDEIVSLDSHSIWKSCYNLNSTCL